MLNLLVKDAVLLDQYALTPMEMMGDRIRMLREARGLTQEGLAKIVGVTKSAISQWEGGSTKNIKLEPFMRLLDALQTDAHYLVFGSSRARPGASAPASGKRGSNS